MEKLTKEEIEILKQDRSITKMILSSFLFLFLIFYTIYHICSGNYTITNYSSKQKLIESKNVALLNSKKELDSIKNKIDNLQDSNLDADLLDEEIRKNTGYAKKNEIIIYSDDLEKSGLSDK